MACPYMQQSHLRDHPNCAVLTYSLTEWHADNIAKNTDSKEVEYFVADKDARKERVRTHGDGKGEARVKDI
jgi:hypothetical protein